MPRYFRTNRILFALAALRLKREEVDEFVRFVNKSSPGHIFKLFRQIEQNMSLFAVSDDTNGVHGAGAIESSTTTDVVNRVITLLKHEARLTNDEIVDGVTEALDKDSSILPRFVAKKSLAEWLSSVSRTVGASKLLHSATVLRNKRVHEPPSPWPLDKPE